MAKKNTPVSNTTATGAKTEELMAELEQLRTQLEQAQERERRALADYQNVVRRNHEDRTKLLKFANREVMELLLQPLDHLSLAAHQLNDSGLNMVIGHLWDALKQAGLKEINPIGERFNLETMEVVEKQGDGETVVKVVKRGYSLNGEVISHAKVIVGHPDQIAQHQTVN